MPHLCKLAPTDFRWFSETGHALRVNDDWSPCKCEAMLGPVCLSCLSTAVVCDVRQMFVGVGAGDDAIARHTGEFLDQGLLFRVRAFAFAQEVHSGTRSYASRIHLKVLMWYTFGSHYGAQTLQQREGQIQQRQRHQAIQR